MKIIEHSYDQMELRSRLWLFMIPFGLAFFIGGVFFFFTLGQATEFTCTRTANTSPECNIRRTMLGKVISDEPLETLRGAYVDSSTDSDGDTTYRVTLQTAQGDVPLTKVWSSGYSKKQDIVTQVEAFLNAPDNEELLVTQNGFAGKALGGIFAVIGLGVIFGGTQTMFTFWYFDRTTMTVTHHRESVFGNRSMEWGLNEFVEAIVAGNHDSDGSRTFRIELVTSMNEHVPLTGWWSSGYRKKGEVADRINQFLHGYS